MKMYAGLDVHSKQCTYVIQKKNGDVVARGQIETSADGLATWVNEFGLGEDTVVGMETGSVTPFVARQLMTSGVDNVRIVNAAEVRAKATRKAQKTDSRDAFEICDGIRRGIYVSIVKLPSAETLRLRALLATRRHFVVAAAREVNAVKSVMRKAGLGKLYRTIKTKKAFARLLALAEVDEQMKSTILAHQRLWEAARNEVTALEKELDLVAESLHGEIDRLQSVPGVGPIVALTAHAYFDEPERFADARHAASYCGLVPQMYNSADRETYGHITKRGPAELRAMLCEAAQHAARKSNPLNRIYRRTVVKKGHKTAVTAIAHRLARILWSMMKNKTSFDPTRYADPAWKLLNEQSTETVSV